MGDFLYARLWGKPNQLLFPKTCLSGTASLKPISWSPKHGCIWHCCVALSFWDTRATRKAVLPCFSWFCLFVIWWWLWCLFGFFSQLPVFSLERCQLPLSEKNGHFLQSVNLFIFPLLTILSGNFPSIFLGTLPTQQAPHSPAGCHSTS